jgi:hypothetical protein
MAKKRKITVKVPSPTEEREDVDDRLKPVVLRPDRGWRDWLLRDYLRYWYAVACIMGDAFVVLWVWQSVEPGLSTSVPFIALTVLVLAEYMAYRSLWGKEGRWKKE